MSDLKRILMKRDEIPAETPSLGVLHTDQRYRLKYKSNSIDVTNF